MPQRLIIAIACIGLVLCESFAENEGPAERATVKADPLPVYAGTPPMSKIVKSLNIGETVRVEFEMEGSDGAWCAIREKGFTILSGYVRCDGLEREGIKKGTWHHVSSSAPKEDLTKTQVIIERNQVIVPVTLSYGYQSVQALLLLDTGATSSVISAEIADRLNIDPDQTEQSLAQVVGGGLITTKAVKLDMSVGPHRKNDMWIHIVQHIGPPVRHDGLLGMDFLHSVRYQIDFTQKTINWTP